MVGTGGQKGKLTKADMVAFEAVLEKDHTVFACWKKIQEINTVEIPHP